MLAFTKLRITAAVAAVAVLFAVAGSASVANAAWPRRDTQPPTTPTNVHVVSTSLTSVTLAWSPSTDNVGVSSYSVRSSPNYWDPSAGAWPPATSATVNGLEPGHTYQFEVYAWDAAYNVSAPALLTASTERDTLVPTAPSGLTVLGAGASTVTLRFTPGTDNDPIEHDVLVNGVRTPNAMSTTAPGNSIYPQTGFVVRQLEPATTYTFAVRARDGSGNISATSNTVTATTKASPAPDTTPPTTPTLLQAGDGGTSVCPEEYNAEWTTSTDDVGPVDYEVRINGEINEVVTWTDHIGYTDVFGWNNVTIVAVDLAGNASAPSNMMRFTALWGVDYCPDD
jgi:chitodextrinase